MNYRERSRWRMGKVGVSGMVAPAGRTHESPHGRSAQRKHLTDGNARDREKPVAIDVFPDPAAPTAPRASRVASTTSRRSGLQISSARFAVTLSTWCIRFVCSTRPPRLDTVLAPGQFARCLCGRRPPRSTAALMAYDGAFPPPSRSTISRGRVDRRPGTAFPAQNR